MLENLSAGKKILAVFVAMGALVLSAGGIILWLVWAVAQDGVTVGEKLAPLGDAATEIKLSATEAHLRMEEIMAGDAAGSFDEVEHLLREAGFYAAAVLDGGENAEGRFLPAESPDLRRRMQTVVRGIEEFRAAARQRYALLADDQGAGSAADERFDALYDGILGAVAAAAGSAPENAAVQALAGEARFQLANGHLLVEESLGGDAGEDFSEALAAFRAARTALESAIASDPGLEAALGPAMADIEAFGALASERRARTEERARNLAAAAVEFDATYARFMAIADEAEKLIHASMQEALSAVRSSRNLAVAMSIGAVIALAAMILASYSWLNLKIGLRLRELSATLHRLIGGDLDARPPEWTSRDEVGLLRASVGELRDALLRQKKLEAEASKERAVAERQRALAEAQKAEADRERARAEQERAVAERERAEAERRAEAAGIFGREFEKVVARAAQGEFDQRITRRFDDPMLAQLAAGMNHVMEEVGRGVSETNRAISRLAGGDVASRMEGSYQGMFSALQKSLNATISELQRIVLAIGETSVAIATDTRGITENAGRLADRATAQAASLEETSATMTEMSETVRSNAESAARLAKLAQQASKTAENGGSVVSNTVNAMAQIDENTRKVSEFVSVINDISFQTNLLALNAGVEAARAGDAGKGFAVVAQEVRHLAQRAAEAARDIAGLIDQGSHDVQEGVRMVSATGGVLKEIVKAIAEVARTTDEITTASREQSIGIQGVTVAVSELDRITQQNAAMAEASATSAKELFQQSQELEKLVAFFRTGQATAAAAGRRKPRHSAVA